MPSTPALNYSQSCFGDNFQRRFPTTSFPGLQLGTSSEMPASLLTCQPLNFGANENTQLSRHVRLIMKPMMLNEVSL